MNKGPQKLRNIHFFLQIWINQLFSEENKVPGTMFEAGRGGKVFVILEFVSEDLSHPIQMCSPKLHNAPWNFVWIFFEFDHIGINGLQSAPLNHGRRTGHSGTVNTLPFYSPFSFNPTDSLRHNHPFTHTFINWWLQLPRGEMERSLTK